MGQKVGDEDELTSISITVFSYQIKALDRMSKNRSEFIRRAIDLKLDTNDEKEAQLQRKLEQKKKDKKQAKKEVEEIDAQVEAIKSKIENRKSKKQTMKKKKEKEKENIKDKLEDTWELINSNQFLPKERYDFDLNKASFSRKIDEKRYAQLLNEINKERKGKNIDEILVKSELGKEQKFRLNVPNGGDQR